MYLEIRPEHMYCMLVPEMANVAAGLEPMSMFLEEIDNIETRIQKEEEPYIAENKKRAEIAAVIVSAVAIGTFMITGGILAATSSCVAVARSCMIASACAGTPLTILGGSLGYVIGESWSGKASHGVYMVRLLHKISSINAEMKRKKAMGTLTGKEERQFTVVVERFHWIISKGIKL